MKTKNMFGILRSKGLSMKNAAMGSVAGLAVMSGSANAAVPTEITDAIIAFVADALLLLAAVGGGAVSIMAVAMLWNLGLALVPKFLKRGARA
ncbi:hypothetical protein [Amphritea japonica]|uniref:Uncharacterized protein n=1 Tax=Amphritea japonica ATCC BAA-1530 TaxID=1278309 RepID=A0A7R6PDR7_9GAMM|nr:hypothetical protein [Amphritea japonica]BBB26246.1 hypothetical protein AMJAP_1651 [Amphritea japonica ATCC BAA-1530]